MCAAFLSAAVITASAYLANKFYFPPIPQKKLRDEKYIGKLVAIILYPLDGGCPYYVEEAICLESGLKHGDVVDRSWVAYSPITLNAILNLHDPRLGKKNIDLLLEKLINHRHKCDSRKEITINYLGKSMTVEDEGDDIASLAQNIFRYPLGTMRIAYCSPENRSKAVLDDIPSFNFAKTVDNLSPYFSEYTLLHSKSLDFLRKKTRKHLTPSNFRANLVFEGSEPEFCEDKLRCLAIGSNFFSTILPCTYTPTFYHQCNVSNPENLEPFKFLKRNRTLRSLRPEFDSYQNPTFGITLSLVESRDTRIKLGDEVTACDYY